MTPSFHLYFFSFPLWVFSAFCHHCIHILYSIDFWPFLQFIKLNLNSDYVPHILASSYMVSSMSLLIPSLLSSKILVKVLNNVISMKRLCWLYLDRLYEICIFTLPKKKNLSFILGFVEKKKKVVAACINLELVLP